MKLAVYSKGSGARKTGHVEDGKTRPLGRSSTLEYIEHERNTDRRHGEEVTMKGLGRLVSPVRTNGGCDS